MTDRSSSGFSACTEGDVDAPCPACSDVTLRADTLDARFRSLRVITGHACDIGVMRDPAVYAARS